MIALNAESKPNGEPRIPTDLVNERIAFDIAQAIWSWNGDPYQQITIDASCGRGCDLIVAGVPIFESAGNDHYLFKVNVPGKADDFSIGDRPALAGYPADLVPELEALARSSASSQLDGLFLMVSSWFPPPRDGQFVLRFDDGNEEGGRAVWVWLDYVTRTVIATLEERT
jgi:hypothetical protein